MTGRRGDIEWCLQCLGKRWNVSIQKLLPEILKREGEKKREGWRACVEKVSGAEGAWYGGTCKTRLFVCCVHYISSLFAQNVCMANDSPLATLQITDILLCRNRKHLAFRNVNRINFAQICIYQVKFFHYADVRIPIFG